MTEFEAKLEAWASLAKHEGSKHADQAWLQDSLHKALVSACHFLTNAKQGARAGDLDCARRNLETAIGIILAGAVLHLPQPELGLLGTIEICKTMQALKN
jgi:hypothetical protein